jgi:hypothetical protein
MNPALITICFQIASKVGPALHSQLADLLGDQVPSWADLAKDHAELDTMIAEAEKV